MTHVTCRLTAKNRDQLRDPTLGNRVWATFLVPRARFRNKQLELDNARSTKLLESHTLYSTKPITHNRRRVALITGSARNRVRNQLASLIDMWERGLLLRFQFCWSTTKLLKMVYSKLHVSTRRRP